MKNKRTIKRNNIRRRVRSKISGTSQRPRLSVYRSNKNIQAQLIDDIKGETLVSVNSANLDGGFENKTDAAEKVGKLLAEKALSSNLEAAVFDRNTYLYHGRIKVLADAAREAGLKF